MPHRNDEDKGAAKVIISRRDSAQAADIVSLETSGHICSSWQVQLGSENIVIRKHHPYSLCTAPQS